MTEQELEREIFREVYLALPSGYRQKGIIEDTTRFIMLHIKSACYLKAERELPENPHKGRYAGYLARDIIRGKEIGYDEALQDMLKPINGVSYKAVKERWE